MYTKIQADANVDCCNQLEFNNILMPPKEVQDIDAMNLGSSPGYLPVNMASRHEGLPWHRYTRGSFALRELRNHPGQLSFCRRSEAPVISPFMVDFAAATLVSRIWSPLSIHSPPLAVGARTIVVEQARTGELTSQSLVAPSRLGLSLVGFLWRGGCFALMMPVKFTLCSS